VSKSYSGVHALVDVSLRLGRGEILGLLGANGAGKTTLLDIIGGEQEPDAGEVRLDGVTLTGPPHRRARLGLARTFQHPKVSMDLSVIENVAIGLAVRKLSTRRNTLMTMLRAVATGRADYRGAAAAACQAVSLSEVDRPASTLSFGELRLVEVARALVQESPVILLDEPFPGLEDDGVEALLAALRLVSASGRSVILVDHNVSLVADLVDRVVLLSGGEVAFEGSVADCLASEAFQDQYIGGQKG
jgi:branched-chain amino acid transport system ATP-binding protein